MSIISKSHQKSSQNNSQAIAEEHWGVTNSFFGSFMKQPLESNETLVCGTMAFGIFFSNTLILDMIFVPSGKYPYYILLLGNTLILVKLTSGISYPYSCEDDPFDV